MIDEESDGEKGEKVQYRTTFTVYSFRHVL
jgi:hypothetical protein